MSEALRVLLVAPAGYPEWTSFRQVMANLHAGARDVPGIETEVVLEPPDPHWSRRNGKARGGLADPSLRARFDVVHAVMPALARPSATLGLPVVVTHHDLIPLTVRRVPFPHPLVIAKARSLSPLRAYRGRLVFTAEIREMREHATLIAAVSEVARRELEAMWPVLRDRTTVVPNIVADSIRPRADAIEALAARGIVLPAGPRVLSIGLRHPQKNLDLLIRAMAEPRLRGATLVRVGFVLNRPLRQLAAGLGVRIHELDTIDDDAKAAVLAACDVLAQPSVFEGFGIPPVEAMAAGTPVVVSDGGALPEVVGDAGIVVAGAAKLGAPAGPFAEALASVIEDATLRASLRARGLARAKQFQSAAVIPQWVDVYRRAMAMHNG